MFSPRLILSLSTLHLPCLMDKWGVNGVQRDRAKRVYSRVKEAMVTGSVSSIVLVEGYQMICDLYSNRIRDKGYRALVYLIMPLYANATSPMLYAASGAAKLAVSLSRISGKITKAQLQSCNIAVAAIDFLIFGEIVPIFDYPSSKFQLLTYDMIE